MACSSVLLMETFAEDAELVGILRRALWIVASGGPPWCLDKRKRVSSSPTTSLRASC